MGVISKQNLDRLNPKKLMEEKIKKSEALRNACEEKQKSQTLDERMQPYAQLIEKIKKEAPEPIYKIVNYQLREEFVELAAAFAFFEEYALLERYIKEGAGSVNTRFNYNILNYNVRPEFAFWEPTPLYFITSKNAWSKMKEPVKMLKYLVKTGAYIDEKAGDGSTPLLNHICKGGSLEILKILLELGANVNLFDLDGNTPLSIARKNNLTDIEELLLEHGALLPDEMENPDDDGRYDAWS